MYQVARIWKRWRADLGTECQHSLHLDSLRKIDAHSPLPKRESVIRGGTLGGFSSGPDGVRFAKFSTVTADCASGQPIENRMFSKLAARRRPKGTRGLRSSQPCKLIVHCLVVCPTLAVSRVRFEWRRQGGSWTIRQRQAAGARMASAASGHEAEPPLNQGRRLGAVEFSSGSGVATDSVQGGGAASASKDSR